MRILILSEVFHPFVGGIETMSLVLAEELSSRGHEVILATPVASSDDKIFPFKVIRQPGKFTLFKLAIWCDIFLQNNISLKTIWPLIFVQRPWIIVHHTWIRRANGSLGWQDRLKRHLLRFATGISISNAIASDLPVATTVIGNPYSDELFCRLPNIARDREIVFLGRLVSDKGPDLLLEAIRRLNEAGLYPKVTFVGAGPERSSLEQAVTDWGLSAQVEFAGQMSGLPLVKLLNRHQVMVIPSLWNEPFGLVALEGIACGCAIVGSEGGGLKEAIGQCGITFRNGDVDALTKALVKLLHEPGAAGKYLEHAQEHLSNHTLKSVVDRYLYVLEESRAVC